MQNQNQGQYFINDQRGVVVLRSVALMLFGVGLLRLAYGEHRGFIAEMCYSGASFFYSRTFIQGNQYKMLDLMIVGLLAVSGLMIDNEHFFAAPSSI